MEYVEIRAKRILNKYKQMDSWFQIRYSMNLYRGCEHGCVYCDGRSNCYWPKGGNETFSTKILVKVNAPYLLAKELSKIKDREPIAVGGGVTDVYQPCEEKYELTRRCLEILARNKYPSHLMTKSALILRDIDILKQLSEGWFFVSISFSTVDDEIASIFEPGCSPPSVRLKVIKQLNERGIQTGVCLMPLIPYLTDTDEKLEESIAAFKEVDARYVLPASMTLRDFQGNYFMKVLAQRFPDLVPKYNELYKSGYMPDHQYSNRVCNKAKELCRKYGVPTKMPRFGGPVEREVQKRLDYS